MIPGALEILRDRRIIKTQGILVQSRSSYRKTQPLGTLVALSEGGTRYRNSENEFVVTSGSLHILKRGKHRCSREEGRKKGEFASDKRRRKRDACSEMGAETRGMLGRWDAGVSLYINTE